jgi:hypothetical protein
MARSWGIAPRDIGDMTLYEILLEGEWHRDQEVAGKYDGATMTRKEMRELQEWMESDDGDSN